jgi:hypothetical protein
MIPPAPPSVWMDVFGHFALEHCFVSGFSLIMGAGAGGTRRIRAGRQTWTCIGNTAFRRGIQQLTYLHAHNLP